jgi:hypothetical protein
MNTKVVLRRAVYGWGKFDIPDSDREYNILSIDGVPIKSTAVGTIAEMCDFLESKGYGMVDFKIEDKDKQTLMKDINVKME